MNLGNSISALPLDHRQFCQYLGLLMKDRRAEQWESLASLAERAQLPESLLQSLEDGEPFDGVDLQMVSLITHAYRIPMERLEEVIRVACVAQLVRVMETVEDLEP